MSLRRILVLLGYEIRHGSKSFIFIFAVIIPLVLSLAVSLLFGSVFTGKPRLGVVDQGDSRLTQRAAESEGILFERLSSTEELRRTVEEGGLDLGVVLPAGLDQQLRGGNAVEIDVYVWGESLLKHRTILAGALLSWMRDVAGQELPVEVISTPLGEAAAVSWEARLLPFVVLMSIVMAGSLIPASSVVNEKQRRTLRALAVTPTSLGEVFFSKALLGWALSVLMGYLTLALNGALGGEPLLLVTALALGAALAAAFGALMGALVKNIDTLFATIKAIGILLYAPAMVSMFPEIPQWIGRLFPTYYMIGPITEISQNGAGWPEVAGDLLILLGLIAALLVGAGLAVRRLAGQDV